MACSFFRQVFNSMPLDSEYIPIPRPESELLAIPLRPSTSQLLEDLVIDPEALKMETHEPGIFDETGDYIPQFCDDPSDLEMISPKPLDVPEKGDAAPEPTPAGDSVLPESE